MQFFGNCKTAAQAKRKFKSLAKEYHPDTGGDAVTFQAVQEEYEQFKAGRTGTSATPARPKFGYAERRIAMWECADRHLSSPRDPIAKAMHPRCACRFGQGTACPHTVRDVTILMDRAGGLKISRADKLGSMKAIEAPGAEQPEWRRATAAEWSGAQQTHNGEISP